MLTLNKIKPFIKFIEGSGAEILTLTSPWEVLRFKANGTTGIVYKNKNDALTFVGEAERAIDSFINKKPYSAQDKIKRKKKSVILSTLLDRDGEECFYCGSAMKDGEETLEHILSIKHGGNNHVANLVLAHKECNQKADSLTVIEKIKLRDKLKCFARN